MFRTVYGAAACLSCFIALFVTGCLSVNNGRTPEQYYNLALSAIAGKEEFRFYGMSALRLGGSGEFQQQVHFEGKLRGHDWLTVSTVIPADDDMKTAANTNVNAQADKSGLTENFYKLNGVWKEGTDVMAGKTGRLNPLYRLEKLGKLNMQMTLEKAAPRGTRTVRIKVSDEDAKKWLIADLRQEMDDVNRRFRRLAAKQPLVKRSELEAELDAAWKKANEGLERRLDSAQVHTVYHLTVDERTLLPQRLSSETHTVYQEPFASVQEESLVADTFFQDYK